MYLKVHITVIFIIIVIIEVNGINTGRSRVCAVGMATGYGLDGLRAGVWVR
jgi:hypothetical protein